MAVKAQRIGILTYAAYVQRQLPFRRVESLPWITYEETMSHLPQARWMMRAAQTDNGQSSLRVHDAETALEGAAAGLGKTLLPILAADGDRRLRRINMPTDGSLPARPIWLLAHADQVGLTGLRQSSTGLRRLSVQVENDGFGSCAVDQQRSCPRQLYAPIAVAVAAAHSAHDT